MTTAIIGIGLPGSGKTTVLKQGFEERKNGTFRLNTAYVCPDDIRQELTGDPANQLSNREVWAEAYWRIHHHLQAGCDVIIDATNAKQLDRLSIIAHCRLKADVVVGVWFVTPSHICLERNQARARVVPEFEMGRMAGWLEAYPPCLEDGFDQLFQVNTAEQFMLPAILQ